MGYDEEQKEMHRDYLRNLNMKYSIMTDGIPILKNISIEQIKKSNLCRADKDEAVGYASKIKCHELFFDSFGDERGSVEEVYREYGSVDSFKYEIYLKCRSLDYGFVSIGVDSRGAYILSSEISSEHFNRRSPILCIDMCEHAYYGDYGFDKERYIFNLLKYINLSKLSKKD